MNSITISGNTLPRIEKPKAHYYKLDISAHSPCEEEDFAEYCINKNIVIIDIEGFKNILNFCNVSEGYMLNEYKSFLNEYGARYVGYSYFFDWSIKNHDSEYKFYFNVKNKKKFNYARIKIGF
jgi:hypothetical protein